MQLLTFESRLEAAVAQAMTNLEAVDLFASGVLKTAQITVDTKSDGTQEAKLFFGTEAIPVKIYDVSANAEITDDVLVADIEQIALAAVETTGQAIWDCHCRNCHNSWQDTAASRAEKLDSAPDENGERCPFCGSTNISASPHASAIEREQHGGGVA